MSNSFSLLLATYSFLPPPIQDIVLIYLHKDPHPQLKYTFSHFLFTVKMWFNWTILKTLSLRICLWVKKKATAGCSKRSVGRISESGIFFVPWIWNPNGKFLIDYSIPSAWCPIPCSHRKTRSKMVFLSFLSLNTLFITIPATSASMVSCIYESISNFLFH